jgi:toxin secretion/phage lysis holin
MLHVIQKLTEQPDLKLYVTGALWVVAFFFGDIYLEAVLAIVLLLIFDTITGIYAAWKEETPIRSRRFIRAIEKSAVFFIAISAAHFTDITLPWNFVQLAVISFVGVNELISIFENIRRIGYRTPTTLIDKLKDIRSDSGKH